MPSSSQMALPLSLWTSLLVLASLVVRAPSQSLFDLSYMTDFPPGCFYTGMEMSETFPTAPPSPADGGTTTQPPSESLKQCQLQAQQVNGAEYFTFYPFSGECVLSDKTAEFVKYRGGGLAVAGYTNCPTRADITESGTCTSEVPNEGFPAETTGGSQAAWPTGRQPTSLECWPMNWVGEKMNCKEHKVLQDTVTGWPGVCKGLHRKDNLNGSTTCEQDCSANASCPSWQLGTEGNCWQGHGINCFVRPGFSPGGAQRIQHGKVRVLMDLLGWQIVGLTKVFDNSQGYFTKKSQATDACKKSCYSDINCQFWQYAPKFGCYVEIPKAGYSPPYPLTTDFAYRNTPFAEDCIAGEFIQHICDRSDAVELPAPVESKLVTTGCAKLGYRWNPNYQTRTVTTGASACQQRCESVQDCAFWSFWPDGGCEIQQKTAQIRLAEDYRVVSGPQWCLQSGVNDTGSPEHGWITEAGQQALDTSKYANASARTWSANVLDKAVDGPEAPPKADATATAVDATATAVTDAATDVEDVGKDVGADVDSVGKDAEKEAQVLLGSSGGGGGDGAGAVSWWWLLIPALIVLCLAGIAGTFLYLELERRQAAGKKGRATRTVKASRSDQSESSPMASRQFSDSEEYHSGSESSSYGGDDQVWQAEPAWPPPEPAWPDPRGGGGGGCANGANGGAYGAAPLAEPMAQRPGMPQQQPAWDGYGGASYRGSYRDVSELDRSYGSQSMNRSSTRVCMSPEMEAFRGPPTGRQGEFTV